jgi:hypothetical protein
LIRKAGPLGDESRGDESRGDESVRLAWHGSARPASRGLSWSHAALAARPGGWKRRSGASVPEGGGEVPHGRDPEPAIALGKNLFADRTMRRRQGVGRL